MKRRPFAITVIGWLFIAVGLAAAVVHTRESIRSFHPEDLPIVALELVAVLAGIFILRGENWARWLAVAWIGFHIAIGLLNGPKELLVHILIFAGITFLLFRADARIWFRSSPAPGS